jgi:hypothetical protein
MDNKDMNISAWILALGAIFTSSTILCAQVNARNNGNQYVRQTAHGRVEPLRAINGQLRGRTITGQVLVKDRLSEFSLSLSKLEIVGTALQLTGTLSVGRNIRIDQQIKARIAGSMARASNPWPGPSDQTEKVAGCGVLFLSLDLTRRLRAAIGAGPRPVQLGVVLAALDNDRGEEINRGICAIVRMTTDRTSDARLAASIGELNRLLASSE